MLELLYKYLSNKDGCILLRVHPFLLKQMSNFKHGWTVGKISKTYNAWSHMKGRCLNKNDRAYKNYGGRGIKVCKRWLGTNGFKNFVEDMGKSPEKMSLDRIDNNGNYNPSNCRWATMTEQMQNRRNTIKVLGSYSGHKRYLAWVRLKKGWDRKYLFVEKSKSHLIHRKNTPKKYLEDINDIKNRNDKIKFLIDNNCSFQDVGDFFGISRQRAYCIYRKFDN